MRIKRTAVATHGCVDSALDMSVESTDEFIENDPENPVLDPRENSPGLLSTDEADDMETKNTPDLSLHASRISPPYGSDQPDTNLATDLSFSNQALHRNMTSKFSRKEQSLVCKVEEMDPPVQHWETESNKDGTGVRDVKPKPAFKDGHGKESTVRKTVQLNHEQSISLEVVGRQNTSALPNSSQNIYEHPHRNTAFKLEPICPTESTSKSQNGSPEPTSQQTSEKQSQEHKVKKIVISKDFYNKISNQGTQDILPALNYSGQIQTFEKNLQTSSKEMHTVVKPTEPKPFQRGKVTIIQNVSKQLPNLNNSTVGREMEDQGGVDRTGRTLKLPLSEGSSFNFGTHQEWIQGQVASGSVKAEGLNSSDWEVSGVGVTDPVEKVEQPQYTTRTRSRKGKARKIRRKSRSTDESGEGENTPVNCMYLPIDDLSRMLASQVQNVDQNEENGSCEGQEVMGDEEETEDLRDEDYIAYTSSGRGSNKRKYKTNLLVKFTKQVKSAKESEPEITVKEEPVSAKFKLLFDGKYECTFCTKVFDSNENEEEHCSAHTKVFICDICGEHYPTHSGLMNHKKTCKESHADDFEKCFNCEFCSFSCLPRKPFLYHMRKVHNIEVYSTPNPEKNKVCTVCGAAFSDYSQLRRHERDIHKIKRQELLCPKCGEKFNETRDLNRHLITHTEKNVKCNWDGCEGLFHTDVLMLRHYRAVHQKIRNFICKECGKKFLHGKGLNHHINCVHEKTEKFECQWAGCEKVFYSSWHLKIHTRLHTGENPVCCKFCDYTCRQRASLKWHLRKHGIFNRDQEKEALEKLNSGV